MKAYYSGYLVSDYAFFPPAPYRGKGWIISFEGEPGDHACRQQTVFEGKCYPGKAVNIYAASEERALYVGDIIYASLCLVLGQLPPFDRPLVVPINPESGPQRQTRRHSVATPRDVDVGDLPLACLIAAKASYRKAYQYALFKHLLSREIFSTNIMDLVPSGWLSAKFVLASREHHVHCAYAILLAYSVLEELSLEMRASGKKPSRIKGRWNPPVKQELERRLKNAGIDLSETILWILRDTPTGIERTRPLDIQSRAEWAGLKVRDAEVGVADAIAHMSWLRSRVSAHKLGEVAACLSYYDVSNAQDLARRLLLERLGFWRYQ